VTTGTVNVRVIKATDSMAITGATIMTDQTQYTVTDNGNGTYTVADVLPGTHTMTAMRFGYGGNRATVSVAVNQTVSATIKLSVFTVEMVTVPAGDFDMGSDSTDPYIITAELPRHTVYLDEYQIGKNLITNAQYKQFIDSGGYKNSAYWTTAGWNWRVASQESLPQAWLYGWFNSGPLFPNYPIVGVSWYEADAFCRWAGMRLPTEAEWEKAARGTDHRYYPWGNTPDGSRCNSYDNVPPDTFSTTSPVGFFTNDASPYGCHDMTGNVMQWMHDWYSSSYYLSSPNINPQGPSSGTRKSLRGGAWNGDAYGCRCAGRGNGELYTRGGDVGFRAVK
jgi:formylglycine-generating enzyme required for sulfatase activity